MSETSTSRDGMAKQRPVEILNSPQFQALFRGAASVLLLFISVVAFVAVTALGDIKDLTVAINGLNIKLTEIVVEGRATSNIVVLHDKRITVLEAWRNAVAPFNLAHPQPPPRQVP